MGVLIVYFGLMFRLRKNPLRKLLVIAVCVSAALSLTSLVTLSPTIGLVFLVIGAIVLGLFAYATHQWQVGNRD